MWFVVAEVKVNVQIKSPNQNLKSKERPTLQIEGGATIRVTLLCSKAGDQSKHYRQKTERLLGEAAGAG
jgi:hypothetical protein